MGNCKFVDADMIASDFGVSKASAYRIIRKLNNELKEKGYITISGKVSRRYYEERTYGMAKEGGVS